ncbi:hypothetical protein G9C01_00070 [Blattabacterium sp. DPU]|uniref:hypothetical protein n=1 Tax=Blattabacterium sp. DPU TaxID=2715232 RepID=UPI00140CC89D|nr:hypothetical protein [Blattabacterium sp. DPU]QIK16390.1 hypothetical protein G9C01_00070 [Blattabacterium sp. DPU]
MYAFLNKKIIIFMVIIIGFIFISLDQILMGNKKNFTVFTEIEKKDSIIEDHNPWPILYISIFYFTSISLGSLFFLSIQNVSKSGWSVIIHPIMEKISSFIPYGGFMIFIVFLLNTMNMIHIFHWMNPNLYDKIIENKKLFLNIPFFLVRSLIYVLGCSFFYSSIKKISCVLYTSHSLNDYKKLYFRSILFIIFFSFISIFMIWDWIMSLNPHWFSTLFSWYVLSSFIITGISTITIIAIYMNKKGYFPFFNKNHLHDLSKYLFSSSLLWTYFWFSQFLLYWYGNIPEEITFFIKREEIYNSIHFWMLIPNFLIPFFVLISSKNKSNYKIVFLVSLILLVGHYIDIYHLIAPDTGIKFCLFEIIGSLLIIGGFFTYILFINFNNRKSNSSEGNPFFQESKNYKYPYM